MIFNELALKFNGGSWVSNSFTVCGADSFTVSTPLIQTFLQHKRQIMRLFVGKSSVQVVKYSSVIQYCNFSVWVCWVRHNFYLRPLNEVHKMWSGVELFCSYHIVVCYHVMINIFLIIMSHFTCFICKTHSTHQQDVAASVTIVITW